MVAHLAGQNGEALPSRDATCVHAAGRIYAVERKASWGEPWSEAAQVAADGATAEWGVSREVLGQAAFFRVVDVTD